MSKNEYTKSVIDRARVARLATVDSESKPHLVPVVFVFDGNNWIKYVSMA